MEALGLDLKLIIAQIINFGILFFLLRKLLYKPVGTLIAERSAKIEKGLKDAEQAAKDSTNAAAKAEETIQKAYAEAEKFAKKAKAETAAESAALIKKASEQSEKILTAARAEAEESRQRALKDAKKEMADIVTLALTKIVNDELTNEQKKSLTSKAISEI